MVNKFLGSIIVIVLLSVSLACSQAADERRIQEIMKQKQMYEDQRTQKPDPPGQMLAGKRLRKAKSKGEKFRSAMLAGTDLREADLEGADLTGAMLLGANLSGANLVDAIFENANLLGAQLEGARIEGANFKNSAWLTQDQIDDACGTPKLLPEGLRAPKGCEQPTIKSE